MLRHRKQKLPALLGPAAAGLLLLAGGAAAFHASGLSLAEIGEQLAVLFTMASMPSETASLLQDRFFPQAADPGQPFPQEPSVPQNPAQAQEPSQPSRQEDSQEEPAGEEPARPQAQPAPEIPEEYRAPLEEQQYTGGPGDGFVPVGGAAWLRNYTQLSPEEIAAILSEPSPISLVETKEPQVLIYHTHATESYEDSTGPYYDTRHTWRSTDESRNMVAVGDALTEVLEEKGIGVIHSTQLHDYPSYNGSYDRSAATVQEILTEYPSIQVVLDIHRDATQREETVIKPTVEIGGRKAAQVMIIAPCDDGTMNIPQWRENLRFAAEIQDAAESRYPGLTRPIFFCYRQYNTRLSTGALLIEIGSHGNTLEEAVYSARLLGDALGDLLLAGA